jgi:NAD(P)-dependent dehydrogenase (short-subunit alcohol dehydrogenase family)
MNKLSNKVAVITGGTSGIGLAAARRFAAEGARVVLFARTEKTLREAQVTVGHDTVVVEGDVSDAKALTRLFEQVRRSHGRVDVLFANAALAKLAPIADTSDELFDQVVTTNLKGTFLTLRHALPTLSDGASVILTTSFLNRIGFAGSSVLAMSKAGIRSLARVAAAELAARKIRVNALSPGAIETPLWGKLGLPEDVLNAAGEQMTSQIPLGRWGKDDEVAEAALFLASDASSYVNGTELEVDGGLRQV